jgi:hypothetical protein
MRASLLRQREVLRFPVSFDFFRFDHAFAEKAVGNLRHPALGQAELPGEHGPVDGGELPHRREEMDLRKRKLAEGAPGSGARELLEDLAHQRVHLGKPLRQRCEPVECFFGASVHGIHRFFASLHPPRRAGPAWPFRGLFVNTETFLVDAETKWE